MRDEILDKDDTVWKKHRRVSMGSWVLLTTGAIGPDSEIALWKAVRRDPNLPRQAAESIVLLASRLEQRRTRARMRADHAQEINLSDLSAADSWWKNQWQERLAQD